MSSLLRVEIALHRFTSAAPGAASHREDLLIGIWFLARRAYSALRG
jgi:hypothetical protein